MCKYVVLLLAFAMLSCSKNVDKNNQKEEENIVQAEPVQEVKPQSKYEIRKSLEGYFTRKGQGQLLQVLPKQVGQDGEGIYCYFVEKNNRVISLSLHIQYSSYNADMYELIVAGDTLRYEANKTHSEGSNHIVAENTVFKWYDKMVNLEDEEFIRRAEQADKVLLVLKTKEKEDVITQIQLTKEECKSLVRTIDYYLALDGAKIPKKGMVNIRSF